MLKNQKRIAPICFVIGVDLMVISITFRYCKKLSRMGIVHLSSLLASRELCSFYEKAVQILRELEGGVEGGFLL
mgnify:CR=1 FL=1